MGICSVIEQLPNFGITYRLAVDAGLSQATDVATHR